MQKFYQKRLAKQKVACPLFRGKSGRSGKNRSCSHLFIIERLAYSEKLLMGQVRAAYRLKPYAKSTSVFRIQSVFHGVNDLSEKKQKIGSDRYIWILKSFIPGELISPTCVQLEDKKFCRE
jgi:hypothetical protein